MSKSRLARLLALSVISLGVPHIAGASLIPYDLQNNGPYMQDWSNTGLITTSDDWSGVANITGFRGDDAVAGTGVDPQTITADYSNPGVVDVNANRNDPQLFTTGGVTEFDGIVNPVVALQGSGTADFPHLILSVNTTGLSSINISYNLRDIDSSADNSVQPVALQYRIGNTGTFTNVPGAFVADASTGPSLAVLVTPVSATDPAWNNQPEVQFRIMTNNAVGNDEWIGVDDIIVAVPEPTSLALLGIAGLTALRRRR